MNMINWISISKLTRFIKLKSVYDYAAVLKHNQINRKFRFIYKVLFRIQLFGNSEQLVFLEKPGIY